MGKCLNCGKETNGRSRYCSLKCERSLAYLRWYPRRGDENYRTGRKRNDILITYDFKCAVCGWGLTDIKIGEYQTGFQHSNGCEIHHIEPISEGGNSEWDNLILLCPNCHKKATVGIYAKDFLRQHVKKVDIMPYLELKRAQNRSDLVSRARKINKYKNKLEAMKNEENLNGEHEP